MYINRETDLPTVPTINQLAPMVSIPVEILNTFLYNYNGEIQRDEAQPVFMNREEPAPFHSTDSGSESESEMITAVQNGYSAASPPIPSSPQIHHHSLSAIIISHHSLNSLFNFPYFNPSIIPY